MDDRLRMSVVTARVFMNNEKGEMLQEARPQMMD